MDNNRLGCYNAVMDKPAHSLWLLQRFLENLKEISTIINRLHNISAHSYVENTDIFPPWVNQWKHDLVCLIFNIQNDHERSKAKPKQFWIVL